MRWLPVAAAPSGLLLSMVGKRPRGTSLPGDLGVSLVRNTQHRMSLPEGGCLQAPSILELVAFQGWDGKQKRSGALGRHPLPRQPALTLGTVMLGSLLCSRASIYVTSSALQSSEVMGSLS